VLRDWNEDWGGKDGLEIRPTRSFGSDVVADSDPFRELIRRVRDRDQAAARELVERYESVIRRVVRIHLRDARLRRVLDSTDVCQSVLASFFVRTALGQYELDSPEQLLGLLSAIARKKLTKQANWLCAQRRDLRRDGPIGEDAYRLPGRANDPSEQVAAREILDKVRERLDDDERYLAEQRSLGRTWKDLADELNGTDAALRKKLTRALDRVMFELGLEEGVDD
jgi:RNA polymerase sigma-70 factor (ECF subfamily)